MTYYFIVVHVVHNLQVFESLCFAFMRALTFVLDFMVHQEGSLHAAKLQIYLQFILIHQTRQL